VLALVSALIVGVSALAAKKVLTRDAVVVSV